MTEGSTIPLTQNALAIVSDEDLTLLNEHKWNLARNYRGIQYAKRNNKGKTTYMHRVVMNAPDGMQVDHINGNGLDNRRSNLRICTNSQNAQNSFKKKNKSSRYKGVCWRKDDRNWIARITHNRKQICIGRYHDEVSAAQAYDKKAIELFGEFANLNFPKKA